MSRKSANTYSELWYSGKLARAATKFNKAKDLAAHFGLTLDALGCGLDRLRKKDPAVPRLTELMERHGKGSPYQDEGLSMGVGDPVVGTEHLPPRIHVPYEMIAEAFGDAHAVSSVADELEKRKEKSQVSDLKRKLNDALSELEKCKLELATLGAARDEMPNVPPIKPRERSSMLREATAVACASDWHIEEHVDAAAVNWVNEYNVEIARKRVGRFFAGFNYLTNYHRDHFVIRDSILWLGGDLITGYLREENLEMNELSPVQAIAALHVWIAEGIRSYLAGTDVEMLRVICNSGNHGRLTDKMRPSSREANSIEWLLYIGLAREFESEPRVSFTLPHGSHTYVQVYDWTIRFLHGDDVKSGGGIGGIMIPIYKAMARWATFKYSDLTVLGHFHAYHDLPDLVVNGSLIGYNPYALSIGARYEEPRQAFFLLDTRRGKTMSADIWVKDLEEELNGKTKEEQDMFRMRQSRGH